MSVKSQLGGDVTKSFDDKDSMTGWITEVRSIINDHRWTVSEIIRAIDLLYSTGAGSSVTVAPAQLANVTFESVLTAGITTVVATSTDTEAELPNRYSLVSGLIYELSTTATVSGSIVMCVSVPWNAIGNRFADVRLLQVRGGGKNARYEDVTILEGAFAPDATSKRVCGRLFSLAPVFVSLRTPR